MAQILKREPVEHKDIVRLSGLTDLQLSKTTQDNFEKLLELRIEGLGEYDDLTKEEISDIKNFTKTKTRMRKSLNQLLNDLHE